MYTLTLLSQHFSLPVLTQSLTIQSAMKQAAWKGCSRSLGVSHVSKTTALYNEVFNFQTEAASHMLWDIQALLQVSVFPCSVSTEERHLRKDSQEPAVHREMFPPARPICGLPRQACPPAQVSGMTLGTERMLSPSGLNISQEKCLSRWEIHA